MIKLKSSSEDVHLPKRLRKSLKDFLRSVPRRFGIGIIPNDF